MSAAASSSVVTGGTFFPSFWYAGPISVRTAVLPAVSNLPHPMDPAATVAATPTHP